MSVCARVTSQGVKKHTYSHVVRNVITVKKTSWAVFQNILKDAQRTKTKKIYLNQIIKTSLKPRALSGFSYIMNEYGNRKKI